MSIKKKLKRFVLGILILLLAGIAFILYLTKDEINATPETAEDRLESFYNSKKMGGFAVSVFTKDSILYSKGFGFADIKKEFRILQKRNSILHPFQKLALVSPY